MVECIKQTGNYIIKVIKLRLGTTSLHNINVYVNRRNITQKVSMLIR